MTLTQSALVAFLLRQEKLLQAFAVVDGVVLDPSVPRPPALLDVRDVRGLHLRRHLGETRAHRQRLKRVNCSRSSHLELVRPPVAVRLFLAATTRARFRRLQKCVTMRLTCLKSRSALGSAPGLLGRLCHGVVSSASGARVCEREGKWSVRNVSAPEPPPRAAQVSTMVPVHDVALASAKNLAQDHQCRRYEDAHVLIPAPEGGIKTESGCPRPQHTKNARRCGKKRTCRCASFSASRSHHL